MTDQIPQYDWQREDFRQFEIGDVVSRAFKTFFRRLVPLTMAAIVLVGLPSLITNAVQYILETRFLGELTVIWVVLAFIFLILGSFVLPAILIKVCLEDFNGRKISLREGFGDILSCIGPLIGAGIVGVTAIIFGLLVIILPGLILACGWYVVVPVIIMERRGPLEALNRSWSLTSGYKWQVFAVIIVGMLVSGLFGAIIGGIGGAFLGLGAVMMEPSASAMSVMAFSAIQAFGGALGTALTAVLIASTYYELRYVREGVGLDQISKIFD